MDLGFNPGIPYGSPLQGVTSECRARGVTSETPPKINTNKECPWGWRDSRGSKALALHKTNPDLYSQHHYGSLSPARSDPSAHGPGMFPEHHWVWFWNQTNVPSLPGARTPFPNHNCKSNLVRAKKEGKITQGERKTTKFFISFLPNSECLTRSTQTQNSTRNPTTHP